MSTSPTDPVAPAWQRILNGIVADISGFLQAGVVHVIVSAIFLQGYASVIQFGAAALLSPAELGIVRYVESLFATLLPIAACGIPSVITKLSAQFRQQRLRRTIFFRGVRIVIVTGVAVTLGSLFFLSSLTMKSIPTAAYILMLTIVPALIVRICNSYLYGVSEFKAAARVCVYIAIGSGLAFVFGVYFFRLHGWAITRLLGDCAFAVALILAVKSSFARSHEADSDSPAETLPATAGMFWLGSHLGLSLFVRTSLDNFPLLGGGYRTEDPTLLGYVGLATLFIQGLTLPLGALNSVMFARMSRIRYDRAAMVTQLRNNSVVTLTVAVVSGLIMYFASPLVPILFGAYYAPAVSILTVLLLALPLRGLCGYFGSVLIILDRGAWTLYMNLFVLLIAWLVGVNVVLPDFGWSAFLWWIVAVEGVSVCLYGAATYYAFRFFPGYDHRN